MAATDNLNPQQFYRGHGETHKPGDLISPGKEGYVYGTTSAATAKTYGPHVYRVEFTGESEPDPEYAVDPSIRRMKGEPPPKHEARRSTSPVRVLGDATDYATERVAAKDFL